ncbi:MAG: hypothetical protein ABI824_07460 [Acidobacteriota bacterium]
METAIAVNISFVAALGVARFFIIQKPPVYVLQTENSPDLAQKMPKVGGYSY